MAGAKWLLPFIVSCRANHLRLYLTTSVDLSLAYFIPAGKRLYRKLDYPESSEKTAYSPAFYKKIRDNFSILLRHFRWDWNDIFLKFGIIFFPASQTVEPS